MSCDADLIIVTSDEPYDGMKHTQVLYTDYLSKIYKVLFIGPPRRWKPWRFLSLLRQPRKTNAGCQTENYINVLPNALPFARAVNEWINTYRYSRYINKTGVNKLVVWHFDSYRSLLDIRRSGLQVRHIYHVIDPFYNNPIDKKLCEISGQIIITSPRNNQFYSEFGKKILNIPQCIDPDKERTYLSKNLSFAIDQSPKFFLLGTISDDLDFDLLTRISQIAPIRIAGKIMGLSLKTNLWRSALSSGKILYEGLLMPAEFYPLLQRSVAGLICYDLSLRSRSFSPLKTINYLVAGIPVISNCETETPELEGKMVFTYANPAEFIECCKNLAAKRQTTDAGAAEQYLATIKIDHAVASILEAS